MDSNSDILPIDVNTCRHCQSIPASPVRIVIVEDYNVFSRYDTYLCKTCCSTKPYYSPKESERVDDNRPNHNYF